MVEDVVLGDVLQTGRECDALQGITAVERRQAQVGQAIGEDQFAQGGASAKGEVSDAGKRLGQFDGCKRRHAFEGEGLQGGDRLGQCNRRHTAASGKGTLSDFLQRGEFAQVRLSEGGAFAKGARRQGLQDYGQFRLRELGAA